MKRKTLKRKISIVGILVFVSMIVYSCWQDEWSSNVTDEVIFDSNKELTIAKAEQWYNATNSSATTVRSLSADGRIPAKPNWNKAKESRKGDLEVVETTLMTSGSTFFMDNETKEKYKLQDDFDKIYNDIAVDDSLESIFAGAAKEFGINENFLKAVAKAESGFDPDAVSGCGAQGIMQLMPFTSESYGVTDPFDAKQNIYAGAQLLSELLDNYNGNATLALAAYNAGSGSVQKYGGVPPYDETVNYINKINDILGGSLAGDSKTIDGASTTDFSVAQNVIAPDIEIKKSTLGTSAEAGKLIGTISTNNDDRLSVGLYNVVTDNDSDVIKNMDVGRKLPDNDMAENSTGYIYSGKELSYDAMTANVNFLNNASYDSVYKNDPQSIYQAQASVISPLVLKLLDL